MCRIRSQGFIVISILLLSSFPFSSLLEEVDDVRPGVIDFDRGTIAMNASERCSKGRQPQSKGYLA
jgi:hypothetical protein